MKPAPQQRELLPRPTPMPGTAFVNDRVCFRTEETHRVISVQGIVFAHYSIEDRAAEAYAMVTLFESGYADQNDIARCFGYSIRTLRRYQRHLESDGLAALARPKGRPSGSSSHTRKPTSGTGSSFASRPRAGVIVGLAVGLAWTRSKCAEVCAGLAGDHLLCPISRSSQKLICRQRAPQYPPTNRVELHPQLRNNLHATARDLSPIRLRKALTLTRLSGRRTASGPQWDFLMMRCRCLLLLRVCREQVSCWQFHPWLPAACFPSLRRSTAASAPLSTDCARLWWPTCCWRF